MKVTSFDEELGGLAPQVGRVQTHEKKQFVADFLEVLDAFSDDESPQRVAHKRELSVVLELGVPETCLRLK